MSDSRLYRELIFTVNTAKKLKNVRRVFNKFELFQNKVYARVIIGGNEETAWRTTSDERNGLNPVWNQTVEFDILETGIRQHVFLVIELYSSQTLLGDKYIGEVSKSIQQLHDYANANGRGGSAIWTLPINTGGTLKFSYSFGDISKDATQSFFQWLLQSGYTIILRERVGKLVINVLRNPFSWGRQAAEPPPWFGLARLVTSRPNIEGLVFRGRTD